ncbi:hypothetical protein [Novosphingobium rosa]|uniref:hypothetical protein n=1 Tax=Novosphingobium rosa TaxID=76978 RepID=UPI0012EDD9C3|nr:hypothetical protein [Novosphingobium rosa]
MGKELRRALGGEGAKGKVGVGFLGFASGGQRAIALCNPFFVSVCALGSALGAMSLLFYAASRKGDGRKVWGAVIHPFYATMEWRYEFQLSR